MKRIDDKMEQMAKKYAHLAIEVEKLIDESERYELMHMKTLLTVVYVFSLVGVAFLALQVNIWFVLSLPIVVFAGLYLNNRYRSWKE